ncbi:MAG: serine/threonine-protein kinase [Fuerstiella sp.]
MNEASQCSDERLNRLIQGDEMEFENQAALEHVDSCSNCQTRLEQLAADSGTWQEAHSILTADIESQDGCGLAQDWRLSDWQRRPISWNESMAQHLLSPPAHPEMLGRIGRYDVECLIGSGGMGVVFKAHDTELNRSVAVKLLAPYLAGNGSARKRFAREARSAAGVVDDHVVPIHNVESEHQSPFLVMQYIAGGSLQEKLDRDGPLEVAEILRIGMQTAKGLSAAHAQGLIHRDVKPSNILLDEGVERALLTDFGLARAEDDGCLTRSGFHPGTPHYMSPEQVRGEAIDSRSDLFGLG